MNKKSYWHPITNKYLFVIVEHMSDWANGKIKSKTHWQKVAHEGHPLTYVIIESHGAKKMFGKFNSDVAGATMALQIGHEKYPRNPTLLVKEAIELSIRKEQVGTFNVLKEFYECNIGHCPYELKENSSSDWKTAWQADLPGGPEADEDEFEQLKDLMTDEIPDENFVEEVKEPKEKTTAQRRKQPGKSAIKKSDEGEMSLQSKLKKQGYQSIPGYGSLWSKNGQLPAEKKIENDKIVNATPEDNAAAQQGGKEDIPQQGKQPQDSTQPKQTVKVVDKDSNEYKDATAKQDGVKRKATTKPADVSNVSTELNVSYSGDKDKSVDPKVAKGVIKSESFTRDNAKSDADFSKTNKDNWLSNEHRMSLDSSAFDKTAVAKTSLKVLERMINTNRGGKSAPTGDRAAASYYNGDEGGAGQAMSQAGELMMLTFMSVDNEEIDEFYETIESFIDENDDMSVLTKDWLVAARKNRDVTYKHLDAKYGKDNWEVQASGWDTEEEFEAMYGIDYKKNKGFSTDAFFTIISNGKPEMLEVSLKKDLGIFFLNSGPQYFMEVDPSLAGGDLDVNVHAQKEKDRTKKAFSKALATEADKILKSKPNTKISKELTQTMKDLKIESVSEIMNKINFNDQKHRKLAYKTMGMLAESGNKKAKKLIKETEQAYKDFSDRGIKEIQDNKKLNEGVMGRIREEFPLKSIAGSEEIMALGDQIIDRATMKEMFGTNDSELIMESLKVYKGSDGEAFLGYAAGQQDEPIPVAKIRLRPAGVGYTGRVKFDFEMHKKFKSVIQSANKKVYGGEDNE